MCTGPPTAEASTEWHFVLVGPPTGPPKSRRRSLAASDLRATYVPQKPYEGSKRRATLLIVFGV
jgi:hypothetical protein